MVACMHGMELIMLVITLQNKNKNKNKRVQCGTLNNFRHFN